MKQHILPALRLTLASALLFCVLYPALIWCIARAAPGRGEGQTIALHGKVAGYVLEGQSFTRDRYFQGRPSAVDYNAAASGASNKGPANPGYLKEVKNRIDTFEAHNPAVPRLSVPAELVTASGSGLDPDIPPEAAFIQIKRIAAARKIAPQQLEKLVTQHIDPPFLGLFGPSKVNVLKLNIALDEDRAGTAK